MSSAKGRKRRRRNWGRGLRYTGKARKPAQRITELSVATRLHAGPPKYRNERAAEKSELENLQALYPDLSPEELDPDDPRIKTEKVLRASDEAFLWALKDAQARDEARRANRSSD